MGVLALAGLVLLIPNPHATPAPVPPAVKTAHAKVPVTLIPQHTCCWCWAASGEMVMKYFGVDKPQCQQANSQFNHSNCCHTPTPDACANGGAVWISHYGFNFKQTGAQQPLSFSQMQDQIAHHEPWIFNIHWPQNSASTFGHVLVGAGWKTVSYRHEHHSQYLTSYTYTTEQYVRVKDPWPLDVGDVSYWPYSQYKTGSYYGSHYIDGFDIYDIEPPDQAASAAPQAQRGDSSRSDISLPKDFPGPVGRTPQEAAQRALVTLGALVDEDSYEELGFSSARPRLALGPPLPVYGVELEKLRAYKAGAPAAGLIARAPSVVFPVTVDAQTRALVQVSQVDGQWTGVSFGQPGLARLLDKYRRASGADKLVHVGALNVFFVARGQGESMLLTPLTSLAAPRLEAGAALKAPDALAQMVAAAQARDDNPR